MAYQTIRRTQIRKHYIQYIRSGTNIPHQHKKTALIYLKHQTIRAYNPKHKSQNQHKSLRSEKQLQNWGNRHSSLKTNLIHTKYSKNNGLLTNDTCNRKITNH